MKLLTLVECCLAVWMLADRAAGQSGTPQAACPTAPGTMRVDSLPDQSGRVRGHYPLPANFTPAPVGSPFRALDEAWVQLIPMTGAPRPIARVDIPPGGDFDLGMVSPGRYLVVLHAVGDHGYGELVMTAASHSLCLAFPPTRGYQTPAPTVITRGVPDPVAAAIGDALGRWIAATQTRDTLPFSLGGESALADAERRAFMLTRGDSAPPPATVTNVRFRTSITLQGVGMHAADSAVVAASNGGCLPSAVRGGSGWGTNGSYLMVRSGDGVSWYVTGFYPAFTGDLRC